MADRNIPIFAHRKDYQTPAAYDDTNVYDDPMLHYRAPWFDRDSLEPKFDLPHSHGGWLPAGIPLVSGATCGWSFHFACHDRNLLTRVQHLLVVSRREFAVKALNGWNRMFSNTVPAPEQSGMPVIRTRSEKGYLEKFLVIQENVIAGCCGQGVM